MRFTKYSQGGEGVQEAVRGCHFNQSTNNEEKNKHFYGIFFKKKKWLSAVVE